MTIPEHISKTTSGVIEALKSSPSLLALILLQVLVLGLIYLQMNSRFVQIHEETMALIERCTK